MSQPTEEAERERLRDQVRTADTPEKRREAIRRLAALERERNRETYDQLARE